MVMHFTSSRKDRQSLLGHPEAEIFVKSARLVAVQMLQDFDVETEHGTIAGKAGDWLATNHPEDDSTSDVWPISAERMKASYKKAEPLGAKIDSAMSAVAANAEISGLYTWLAKTFSEFDIAGLEGIGNEEWMWLWCGVLATHLKKAAGYSGKDNPDTWANFREAEAWGLTPLAGCLVRMGDKYRRVQNLRRDPDNDRVGESMKDTLLDLANYAVIAVCLLMEEEDAAKKLKHKPIKPANFQPGA